MGITMIEDNRLWLATRQETHTDDWLFLAFRLDFTAESNLIRPFIKEGNTSREDFFYRVVIRVCKDCRWVS